MTTNTPDGDAIREIERLALATTPTVEIDGKAFSRVPLHDPREPEPTPPRLDFHTLESLADYLKSDHDDNYTADVSGLIVHVASPTEVRVVTEIFGPFHQRATLATAEAITPRIAFETWQDPETFNILLQAHFEDTTDRAGVLSLVGGLRTEAVQTLEDDGVSQTATARKGVVSVQQVRVPNPVMLRPRRTFVEVAQVESPFILRLRGGGDGKLPSCALFEADGGAWRLTAIQRIKEWLLGQLGAEWTVLG